MKRILIVILLLTTLAVPITPVMASDVSGATYYGTIRATNNSTLATGVSANVTISTADLIAAGLINSTANNTVIRRGATDMPFMPGWNGNPWIVWYDSVPASGSIDEILYTNSTGGKLRYFPDSTGMTVDDDATIEISDNGTAEIDAYLQNSGVLIDKPGAFTITYDSTTENVSAGIWDSYVAGSDWTSPTSSTGTNWTNVSNAIDDNTTTYASYNLAFMTWSDYIYLTIASGTMTGEVRYWITKEDVNVNDMQLDVYYSGGWQALTPALTTGAWVTEPIGSYEFVTNARMRFYSAAADRYIRVHEFDYNSPDSVYDPILTATGVTAGEHEVILSIEQR